MNVDAAVHTTPDGEGSVQQATPNATAGGSGYPCAKNAGPIRLLVLSGLYPNAVQPRHGVFVEERLRKLVASGRVTANVVAPVPWFPSTRPRFGAWAVWAQVPAREQRHGIDIEHPRYPVIPKLGMNVAATLMYRSMLPVLRKRLERGEDFDVLDAHYLFPDGVAAARLAKALDKPVVVTARGSDVTLIPHHRSPRRQIVRAAARADAIITVSEALKDGLVALGIDEDHITTLRNGVDLERFRPLDRAAIRTHLRLAGPVWLTVGHLLEPKGVHLAIRALVDAADATLLVAGNGPEDGNLRRLAENLGVAARVRFLGTIPHDDLCNYYNAADALIHPSSREGMPNVVLEALGCGTPVVAAPFAGVTEVLAAPEAGEIAETRTAGGMAAAWERLQRRMPARAATRAFAERLGWDAVVDRQCALYERVVAARSGSGARS